MVVIPQPEPLSFPSLGGWNRFLMGIPLLGPQRRMFRSICRQLEERGPEVIDLWGSDPQRLRTVQVVSEIIAKRNGWPNTRFIPRDPFSILMWDRHSTAVDELAAEEIAGNIEKALGVSLLPAFWSEFDILTYGRAMDRLMELVQVQHESF